MGKCNEEQVYGGKRSYIMDQGRKYFLGDSNVWKGLLKSFEIRGCWVAGEIGKANKM